MFPFGLGCPSKSAKFHHSTSSRTGLPRMDIHKKEDFILQFLTLGEKVSRCRISSFHLGGPSTSLLNFSFLPHLEVG
jgi:hypothetical protein